MLMTAIPMNQKSGKNIKVIQYNPPATRNFMYTLWACLLASQVQFFLIAFWTLVCSKTNKYTKKELQCWIAIGLIFRGGAGGRERVLVVGWFFPNYFKSYWDSSIPDKHFLMSMVSCWPDQIKMQTLINQCWWPLFNLPSGFCKLSVVFCQKSCISL